MRSLRALTVWAGGAAFFVGALVLLGRGGRRAAEAFPPGSVFNESPQGISLAYRYLLDRAQRAGAPVSVLSRPVGPQRLPLHAVLFRIRPRRRQAESLLTRAEEDWVCGGGRLVLGVDTDYGPLTTTSGRPAAIRKVFPLWPGVRNLVSSESTRALVGAPVDEAHAVFARGPRPVLSRLVLGRGDVLLLGIPESLENAHLPKADHLRLLVALAGEGRPLLFDEWAQGHGRDETLLELMLEWGFGPALVGLALTLGLWLWRGRARLGPEDRDPAESRSEAVDLVDSLAQLYDRALSRREAARLYREGFQRAVGLRTGLQGAALTRRADELLGRVGPGLPGAGEIPPSEFLRTLRAINEGYRRLHEHAQPDRRL